MLTCSGSSGIIRETYSHLFSTIAKLINLSHAVHLAHWLIQEGAGAREEIIGQIITFHVHI